MQPIPAQHVDSRAWCLIECKAPFESPQQIGITKPRTIVGRSESSHVQLVDSSVSGSHAEFLLIADELFVRDLNSTNGTFLNGDRIVGAEALHAGDIVQLANCIFRVSLSEVDLPHANTLEGDSNDWSQKLVQFDRLMSGEMIDPHYQPIVSMLDESLFGYELLARCPLDGLRSPADMFAAAARLGQEARLSVMARKVGVTNARPLESPTELFVNTHPVEVVTDELLESVVHLRRMAPDLPITIEIHEGAVTDHAAMTRLKVLLQRLDMKIAYDDFGAGMARLSELTDFAPDYVKFDMGLIRDIDLAGAARQSMVESLVRMVNDLGIISLAEGVETEGEIAVSRQMGFHLAQGFFYGRPAALAT